MLQRKGKAVNCQCRRDANKRPYSANKIQLYGGGKLPKVSPCDHSRVDLLFCYIPQIRKANSQGKRTSSAQTTQERFFEGHLSLLAKDMCKSFSQQDEIWCSSHVNDVHQYSAANIACKFPLFFTHHVCHRVTSHPYCPKLMVRIVESGEKRTEVPLHHASFFVICFLCLFSGKYLWQLWFLCPGKTGENYLARIVC